MVAAYLLLSSGLSIFDNTFSINFFLCSTLPSFVLSCFSSSCNCCFSSSGFFVISTFVRTSSRFFLFCVTNINIVNYAIISRAFLSSFLRCSLRCASAGFNERPFLRPIVYPRAVYCAVASIRYALIERVVDFSCLLSAKTQQLICPFKRLHWFRCSYVLLRNNAIRDHASSLKRLTSTRCLFINSAVWIPI